MVIKKNQWFLFVCLKKPTKITLLLLLLLLSSFIYLLKNSNSYNVPVLLSMSSSPTCCCFSSRVLCLRWLAVLSHDFHCVWLLTRIPPTELQLAVRTYIESETILKSLSALRRSLPCPGFDPEHPGLSSAAQGSDLRGNQWRRDFETGGNCVSVMAECVAPDPRRWELPWPGSGARVRVWALPLLLDMLMSLLWQ